jgi:NADH-quinone oxidoreductase subunit M
VENPENRGLIDLGLRERAILVAVLVPIVWIGVHPETFLRKLHPPVLELLRTMERKGAALTVSPSAEEQLAALAGEEAGR